MKKFKLDNVQTLSAVEMEKLNGGCFWCSVHKVIRPVIGGALAVGGAVTGNVPAVAIGIGLAVTK